MADDDEQRQKRTPFSAKLPQVPVDQAVPVVEALAALGAPSTPHVIAQQMGTTFTSSVFKTRLAAVGYYGFVSVNGDRRTLTSRGEALTSGDASRARQARREAVMSTRFGPIIHTLRGRAINENTVALRIHSDYDVPDTSAANIAKALIESARQAQLVTDDRFDASAIEAAAGVMPSTEEPQAPAAPKPQRERTKEPEPKPPVDERPREEEPRPLPAAGVQVVVRIDAAHLSPKQIAELVRELQQPPATT